MKLALISSFLWNAGMASSFGDNSMKRDFMRRMNQVASRDDAALTERLMKVATPLNREEIVEEPRFLEEYAGFAVNLTEYALKYVGCQQIHTYSDDMAEEQDADSVLQMDRFVLVRLCPKETCSNYHEFGCQYRYGDYLIPMDDYLEAMFDDYYASYMDYCEQCYDCMHPDNDGQNDANYYNETEYNVTQEEEYQCEFYEACQNYHTACKDYSQEAADMQEYFQCVEFNMGNNYGYLGPHCRSDGKTIGIGLFKDENCNSYNSEVSDVSQYTGIDFSDDYLKPYYTDSCISCLASVRM